MSDGPRKRIANQQQEQESRQETTRGSQPTIAPIFSRCTCCSPCTVVVSMLHVIAALVILVIIPSPFDCVKMELAPFHDVPDNTVLRSAVRLFEGKILGPEGFAVDAKGNIYTGLADGRIIKFTDDNFTTVARLGQPPYESCSLGTCASENHCGRGLGMRVHPKDPSHVYIVDCYHGIVMYNSETGSLKTVLNISTDLPKNLLPPKMLNTLVILDNGSIFFTDSSSKFARCQVYEEVMMSSSNGRLLHYNPFTRAVHVVVDGLYIPNGICLSASGDHLLIPETSRARIKRYHLVGAKAGTVDVFMEGLPGIPDNISPRLSGGYWIAYAGTRHNGLFDLLGGAPWARNIIAKLGLSGMVKYFPTNTMITAVDEDGSVIRSYYDMDSTTIGPPSEVLDIGNGLLYLGSYNQPYLARVNITSAPR